MTEAERQIAFRKAWDARVVPSSSAGERGPTCQCHGRSIIGTRGRKRTTDREEVDSGSR